MNDSDYYYLTMTLPDSDSVKVVHKSGQIWGYDIISYMGEVRPVINIYKSAIQN